MDITKIMTFTSAEYHMLKLAARGEGKKPEEFLASLLTRFFRAMADLQGIESPVTVTPEHLQRPGRTHPTATPAPVAQLDTTTPAPVAPRVLPPAPPAQPELPVLEFDPSALRLH